LTMARRILAAAAIVCAVRAERYTVRPHAHAGDELAQQHVAASKRSARKVFAPVAVFLASMGVSGTDAQAIGRKTFKDLDADGNGVLDEAEFLAVASQNIEEDETEEKRQDTLDYYKRLFAAADSNGDGTLNEKEVAFSQVLHSQSTIQRLHRELAKAYNEEGKDGAEAQAEESFDEFGTTHHQAQLEEHDENGNGVIDKDEYIKAMKSTAAAAWGMEGYLEDPDFLAWLDKIWEYADMDQNGSMNAHEVQYVSYLGDAAWRAGRFSTRALANALLDEIDEDKDGKISKAEVEKLVQQVEQDVAAKATAAKEQEEAAKDDKDEHEEKNAEKKGSEEKEEEEGEPVEQTTMIERMRDLFATVDEDGDENLDRQEVVKMAERIMRGEL